MTVRKLIFLFGALTALSPIPVSAQYTATMPSSCRADGSVCVQATPVVNPDGTLVGSGSGSATRSTAAGTSDTQAVPVQGVTGGVAMPISAAALPLPPGASTAANQASMLAQMPALAATGSTAATNGLQTFGLASSTAPTAATAGNGVRAWYGLAGQSASSLVDLSTGNAIGNAIASSTPVSGTSARGLFTIGFGEVWDGSNWQASPGDTNGNRSHGPAGALTDGSGTVTTGGTSQQVFAANTARLFLSCQNPVTATETLFVNIGAAASTTGGSFEIAPGAYREFTGAGLIPSGTINITAATSGHRFVCKQG